MGFRGKVSEDALVASGRCCSLCHKFCGSNIELHHIKQAAEGGKDIFDNCIPLCFDCHAGVKSYNSDHPKGKKYTESELKRHRDNWYKKVDLGLQTIVNKEPAQIDIDLYHEIKLLFSIFDLKYYLTEFDLGNCFNDSVFLNLHGLITENTNPEFEFLDEEIEKLKGNLINSVKTFLSFKSQNTFTTDHGMQAIRPWFNKSGGYDDNDRKLVDDFNSMASSVWNDYCVFVKECRRQFRK